MHRKCLDWTNSAKALNSNRFAWVLLVGLPFCSCFHAAPICSAASRRQSAEEWRRLTTTNAPLPRVLVHDDEVRFYFPDEKRPLGFKAKLGRLRLPTEGYQV